MSPFNESQHLPRPPSGPTWAALREHYGKDVKDICEIDFDLRSATFHTPSSAVEKSQLMAWRTDLNEWAFQKGLLDGAKNVSISDWDVDLGVRLVADIGTLPEFLHPETWCWIATNLLPHFVVFRWGWPALEDGEVPNTASRWVRFGRDLRNGLRLATHRIFTYGEELSRLATEQEFQSIQYRPAYGLDQRVARLILQTLVEAAADRNSNYGKNGGSRALDCNEVCIELRVLNSMRPLCFASDSQIVTVVHEVIERLPQLRRSSRQQ